MAFRDSHTWKLAVYTFFTQDITLWYTNDIGEIRADMTTVLVTNYCMLYVTCFGFFENEPLGNVKCVLKEGLRRRTIKCFILTCSM